MGPFDPIVVEDDEAVDCVLDYTDLSVSRLNAKVERLTRTFISFLGELYGDDAEEVFMQRWKNEGDAPECPSGQDAPR